MGRVLDGDRLAIKQEGSIWGRMERERVLGRTAGASLEWLET